MGVGLQAEETTSARAPSAARGLWALGFRLKKRSPYAPKAQSLKPKAFLVHLFILSYPAHPVPSLLFVLFGARGTATGSHASARIFVAFFIPFLVAPFSSRHFPLESILPAH